MLTCFNVKKHTHYFSNTVHYCRSSMLRLSQKQHFLQSPSFRQAQSVLIGQLTQCIVIGRTTQACVGNVTPLSIIASFSFQNNCKRQLIMSLVLPSVQARKRNRVPWQTQWWSSYVFAHKPLWCDPLSLSLSLSLSLTTHTHTHTHTTRKAPHWNNQ